MKMPKEEVRVFLDKIYLDAIDKMIKEGHGTRRGPVVRMIVQEWLRDKERVK